MTDAEIEVLRDQLYALADLALEAVGQPGPEWESEGRAA